jgi:transposase InsO family protein
MLCVVDEITRECLAIRVDRKLGSAQVLETLAELMLERGVPEHIRSDNGSDSVAQAVQDWIAAVGSRTACIEPDSPGDRSQGGYVESFNSKLRHELPNREIFSLREAQILIEAWRQHCIAIRPHSAPRWTPPAPVVRLPKPQIRPAATLAHYVAPNYH